MNKEKLPIKGYLFLILTAFFTALSYALGRALGKGQDPVATTFFWFFGAFIFALILAPFIPSQRYAIRNLKKYKNIFLWSSFLTSIGATLWIISLWTIGAPLTSFLMKAQTVFSLLLGVIFLGERLNRGETLGILITIPGGIIVAYQTDIYLLTGTITALSAAFFYSFLAFIVKKIAQHLNMLMVATLRCSGVSIVLIIYLFVTGTFHMPAFNEIIIMAFGGITGAYVAKASQFQAIKLLDISRTTAVMPLESIFVVILSYFLFNEIPSLIKLIGGAGIISGIIILIIFRSEKTEELKEK